MNIIYLENELPFLDRDVNVWTVNFNQHKTKIKVRDEEGNETEKDVWEIHQQRFDWRIPTLSERYQSIIDAIDAYDKSINVNSFYCNGRQYWIDRDTRVSLMNSTTILKNSGVEMTTLWFGTESFTIPCDLLLQLLGALEQYALACYNVTAQHKAHVWGGAPDDSIYYDYTAGYPEKLTFDIPPFETAETPKTTENPKSAE